MGRAGNARQRVARIPKTRVAALRINRQAELGKFKWSLALRHNAYRCHATHAMEKNILVPFAIEAPLSGVGIKLLPTQALWYKRQFTLKTAPKEKLHLHFEAVDYITQVWLNGTLIAPHTGS